MFRPWSMQAPAATGGDAAKLFDIDVDQRSGGAVFVAVGAAPRGAHRFSGDGVDGRQMRHVVACQGPSDRRGHQPEFGGEHHRTPLAASPGCEHLLLDAGAGALGHPDRA